MALQSPVLRGEQSTSSTTNASSITVAFPTYAAGDYMLVHLWRDDSNGSENFTTPAGWTLIHQAYNQSDQKTFVFGKVMTGSEGSSQVFTLTSNNGVMVAFASAWSGVDPNAPVNVQAIATGYSSTVVAPSLTTTVANCVLVCGFDAAGSPSPAMTNIAYYGTNWDSNLFYRTVASSGATGTESISIGGGVYWAASSVALAPKPNTAPNAPTPTAPANNSTINLNTVNRFAWQFSDPDLGDSQSKFDLQYRQGSGAWTTVTQVTPNQYYDVAAGTFTAGTFEWQVRTYDSQGVVGPWSVSSFFTAATPPDGPTITDPINGQTLPSSTYTVTFSYPSLTAYAWRVLGDNAGAPDTGNVINAGATVIDTSSRQFTVTGLPNSTTVHIQVQVQSDGLWSAWTDSTNPVQYDPPPPPAVSLTADEDSAALAVTWTVTAPGAGEVAASYVDVYRSTDGGVTSIRVATQLAPNGSWIDYTPASGVDYSYRVVAVAGSGVETGSEWAGDDFVSGTVSDIDEFLPGGAP